MSSEITIDRMVECAKRELAMRKRVYPRWVRDRRMTKAEADEEIAVMKAIVGHLQKDTGLFAP